MCSRPFSLTYQSVYLSGFITDEVWLDLYPSATMRMFILFLSFFEAFWREEHVHFFMLERCGKVTCGALSQ